MKSVGGRRAHPLTDGKIFTCYIRSHVVAAQLHIKSPYMCPSTHLFIDTKLTIMYSSIELAELHVSERRTHI